LLEKLKGREIGQRLVGADGVVGALPGAQLAVQLSQLQRVGRDLIKLFRVGTVRAFDRAIEFGGAWRQHEQVQTALLASLLELSRERRTAVDLQGADGKGHAVSERVEELRRTLGSSAGGPARHPSVKPDRGR